MAGPSNTVDLSGFLAALLGSMGAGSQGADFTQQFRRLLDPAFVGEGMGGSGGRALEIQQAKTDQPSISMVDPRTDTIRALEAAGLFPMIQSLLNPQWLSNKVLADTGPVYDRPTSGLEGSASQANPLMQMIFGGSAGGAGTPWTPPGRGGGAPSPPVGPGGGGGGGPTGGGPQTGGGGAPGGGAPSGNFPRDPGAGTGAGTNWGNPRVPSGIGELMQPGFQNFNEKGEPDPQGNYNRDGSWIGPAHLKPPGENPDRLRKTLLAGIDNPSKINWGAYGFDDTPEHNPLPNMDWSTYSWKAPEPSEIPPPTELARQQQTTGGPGTNFINMDRGQVDINALNAILSGYGYKPLENRGSLGAPNIASTDPNLTWGEGYSGVGNSWENLSKLLGTKGINLAARGTPQPDPPGLSWMAQGGMMDPSKMTIVGEQGPEAIVPTPQGQQVMPLGGGGMNPMMAMMQLMMQGAKGMAQGGILEDPITDPNQPILGGSLANTNNPTGNPGQFSQNQQPGALGQAAAFNPELDAFNSLKTAIGTGWGSQGNTAFNLGAGLLGNTQGLMNQTRNLASQSAVDPAIQQSLTGQLTQNPGQGVMNALQPVWNQNLQNAFGQLRSSAPSIFNSAQQLQGTDLAQRSLNDFNLLSSQALQQGVGQQQNAASILGQLLGQNKGLNIQALGQAGQLGQGAAQTLGGLGQGAAQGDISALQTFLGGAGQAGQGQFGRLNQAAQTGLGAQQQGEQSRQFNLQYDLAAQNQAYNQAMNPTLQLLLAAMGLSEPTGLQTVVGSQRA